MNQQGVERAVAVVGVAAIMPDAPDAATFWQNIKDGRYSISDVSADRWDPELYYDPDRSAPDKTYSKIGSWVREFEWNPLGWKLPIPPKVAEAMDDGQKWGVNLARAALVDYGWPDRPLDNERTAVIIGNALGGEKHYQTTMRVLFPEFAREVEASASFAALSKEVREAILEEARDGFRASLPPITEDTMPGELANITAGRIANVFNFRGPNYITDAACASGLAAMSASVEGLVNAEYDAVLTGGIDRNMGVNAYVKFSKIGALSATGTRPYGEGADGFVMGEGGTLFLLKRLEDAERDGDRIYAVVLALAGSSDGKGKGITAPNPVGQKLAVERAWELAGYSPATCSLVEGHGTSTAVGDVVEAEALAAVFGRDGVAPGSIPLGSVKSNIGHLKGAAGTAGVFKTVMALHEKLLPPSIHAERPNPNIDFSRMPFKVNGELREWPMPEVGIRRAGVSAFGFGGTNFHAVLEEYEPGRHRSGSRASAIGIDLSADSPQEQGTRDEGAPVGEAAATAVAPAPAPIGAPVAAVLVAATEPTVGPVPGGKPPLRGIVVVGAADDAALAARLREVAEAAAGGSAPAPAPPSPADLKAPVRVAIDYGDASELASKADKAAKAVELGNQAMWRALRAQGVFMGRGEAGKVAFLYTGQGSQYVNMLDHLREIEPIVADAFAEADVVMTPLLGKPLTDYIFIDGGDADAVAQLELQLLQTEITQPAVLATDLGLTRLLAAYGIKPDLVMGHSLGEYGALMAAGALTFDGALEAVSARGSEMAHLDIDDNGAMAAVLAPLPEIERIVGEADGYVVIANVNSTSQGVIGGATDAVGRTVAAFTEAGHTAIPLPVSMAFHTSIVAPASAPLRDSLIRLDLKPPVLPIVANVDGELYPTGEPSEVVEKMLDILARQVASPVQFVKGLHTLYDEGARIFVEVGPKKALHGFVEDVLGQGHDDVVALFTNHPKQGDVVSFNQALSGLYAAGLGTGETTEERQPEPVPAPAGRVVITGASIGLAGTDRVFDDDNVARILSGEVFIKPMPMEVREAMARRNITRLVKSEAGNHRFEVIDSPDDVIKLAARAGQYDVVDDFGVDPERDKALADYTRLAVGAGFEALRDAGIPLIMHYKTTSLGTKLPERWALPASMRDTGVIFASAFPGLEEFADDLERYVANKFRQQQLEDLQAIRKRVGRGEAAMDIDQRIGELEVAIDKERYELDRRYLFRVLSMGHAQFAEIIGARGPNTQINSACASTTQALAIAEDWIRAGRCRRVVVISAENATNDRLMPWVGGGFLASGAAATDERVEDAALPFDNRRHGMLLGMGATGIVVESAEAAAERGIQPVAELLSTVTANSAFHGTKLDIEHICQVMEELVSKAEARGFDRHAMADEMIFMSHETYTPARGGSASAEITALRRVFGPSADKIVIANAKGQTGHTLTVGVEDVLALKALETGVVPPVANFKEVDPSLGPLNLAAGGDYQVRFALHLAAGFGSQISMDIFQWTPVPDGVRRRPEALGYEYRRLEPAWSRWLTAITGRDDASLEVVQRRLRVVDTGAPAVEPAGAPAAGAKAADEAPLPTEDEDEAENVTPPGQPVLEPDTAVAPVPVVEPTPEEEPVPATRDLSNVDVAAEVLALVADKTGYPADMLDPDLDLEADLGIDTVKQAEVFASIRESFDLDRDDKLKLRDYPTLGHVIGYVNDRLGGGPAPEPAVEAKAPEPEPEPQVEAGAAPGGRDVAAEVLALVADKTGYPADMLDPDLDLEADLGIDTVKQAEVFASIRESFDLDRDDKLKLRDYPTLGHVIGYVNTRLGGGTPAAEAAQAEPEPEPEPQVETPAGPDGRDVAAEVIALVADKTGYPADMLDPDLDLEADLGIDTVKQAEVFASIRESFDLDRDDKLKLRDYPTLGHVIGYVNTRLGGRTPAAEAPQAEPEPEPVAAPAAVGGRDVAAEVIALVADKTGYPADMLDPDLDLEADLGIDTVKQAEVFASIRESFDLDRDDKLKLRDYPTLGHVIGYVNDRLGGGPAPEPAVEAKAPEPEPEPAAAPATAGGRDVAAEVIALVADKTGYPADMFDPDLDLEADLGIDTVKQAEVFASIRESFDLDRDDKLKLRDYPTLGHVIGYVIDRTGGGAPAPAAETPAVEPKAAEPISPGESGEKRDLSPNIAETAAAQAPAAPKRDVTVQPISDADGVPRRVPVPTIRPALAACAPTGVKLKKGRRVVVGLDRGGVGAKLADALEAQGVEVLKIKKAPDADSLNDKLAGWLADGPVHGVYWLKALDHEGPLADMDLAEWQEANRVRVKLLYTTMRTLYEQINDEGTFLISATRLGGRHGYDAPGAFAPMGGAVTGFTKAFAREKPEALVKAVDVGADVDAAHVAEILVEETLHDAGVVEVGHADLLRWTVTVDERPAADGGPGMAFGPDTVFVVTGAAGSIVSAITADLAGASGGVFHLLDLTPKPDPDDPDIRKFTTDREGLKTDIIARLKDAGERPTPVMVEKQLAGLERLAAAQTAIDAVHDAGGQAYYHSGDLRDGEAMAAIVKDIADRHGKIDVLLHAAGLEISRFLPDKEPGEFDLVFGVKSDGWFNLISAIGDMPLGATVGFSSVAGRFGNGGQTDYSSANDLLCKLASGMRTTRPDTRAIVIDWTAWGGIGMATRGSIPKMMEMAGIEMLPKDVGIPTIRRELTAGATRGEIVVAGKLGILADERAPLGGIDPTHFETSLAGPMVGQVVEMGVYSGLVVETTLDPKEQPFLDDHRVEGTPLLPGVMGVEAFAEVAQLPLPGWHVVAIEDVDFLAPFKFYRDEPRPLRVTVTYRSEGDELVAECRLTGSRQLPNQPEPQVTEHFRGRVRLAKGRVPAEPVAPPPPADGHAAAGADAIYAVYFHGPAYQVLDRAWRDGNQAVGLFSDSLPADHKPAGRTELASPRLIELFFQTAGMWEIGRDNRFGLPQHIDRVVLYEARDTLDSSGNRAVAMVEERDGGFGGRLVDSAGNVLLEVHGYRTAELPGGVDPDKRVPLAAAMA